MDSRIAGIRYGFLFATMFFLGYTVVYARQNPAIFALHAEMIIPDPKVQARREVDDLILKIKNERFWRVTKKLSLKEQISILSTESRSYLIKKICDEIDRIPNSSPGRHDRYKWFTVLCELGPEAGDAVPTVARYLNESFVGCTMGEWVMYSADTLLELGPRGIAALHDASNSPDYDIKRSANYAINERKLVGRLKK